jgi:ABC-type Na+ efflux pump permease subunit
MRRLWLIARREIAAYASLPSFWIALLLGPALILLTGLAGASSRPHPQPPPPAQTVELRSADPGLASAAAQAIAQANATGATHVEVIAPGGVAPANTVVTLDLASDRRLSILIEGQPVPAVATTLVRQAVTSQLQQRILTRRGVPLDVLDAISEVSVEVAMAAPPAAPPPQSPAGPRVARFAIVMLLWMNLVGALGMLLQAIVRERSHRSLEGLLASTRPQEIIFGKLLGVGLLSILVLAAWLGVGAGVAAGPLAGAGAGFADMLLGAFKDPSSLAGAAVVYVMAFAMYGSALIGLGAMAKDLPSAQNLSRPIFGVLLLVFFLALSQLTGAVGTMPWLVWVPPLTPFMLLMAGPGTLSAAELAAAFAIMAVSTVALGALASTALGEPRPLPWRRVRAAA